MNKVNHLVVNGCSYMEAYSAGSGDQIGHVDLARRLGIETSESLAIGGSANTRIIRTTLKHSYQTAQPTLYVLGMTFLSRLEIPILENQSEFEGRWTNPQNQQFVKYWQYGWGQSETDQFIDIKLKSEIYSILDRVEDLMYKILSMISDLHARGHRALVYQQADPLYQEYLDNPRLARFKSTPAIIDGYRWRSVPWQLSNGVPPTDYGENPIYHVPDDMKHPMNGFHQKLNEFLVGYIHQNSILSL
jgi:hypothetical protein